jgi:short-subunit dehydrogenase
LIHDSQSPHIHVTRNKDSRKTVIVTGCSSGIGFELAKLLARSKRYRTIITARSRSIEILRKAFQENENFLIRELDVTVPEQVLAVVEEASRHFGQIDLIINNAGICYRGVVEHMDEQSEMDQIRTNYLGPIGFIRQVLPIMREQKSGCIVNVSSLSGNVPMPTMGSYSASKHALEAASEALWYEAHPYGIRIHCVQPGFVRSDSYMNVKLSNKAKISEALYGPHSEFYSGMTPFIDRMMHFAMAGPDKVARRILTVANAKYAPLFVPVTIDAVVLSLLKKILPQGFFNRLMYFLLPVSSTWGKVKQNSHSPELIESPHT